MIKISQESLTFKTVKQREISGFHKITVTVILALRALGKDNITQKEINILKRVLSKSDKEIILKEGLNATARIVQIIKEICMEENQFKGIEALLMIFIRGYILTILWRIRPSI